MKKPNKKPVKIPELTRYTITIELSEATRELAEERLAEILTLCKHRCPMVSLKESTIYLMEHNNG